jgi:RimJ/RimL family protein N-acetyltransferase
MSAGQKPLFKAGGLSIRKYTEDDIPAILEVYHQNEDFLSLGPVPKASLTMVRDDIEQSSRENSLFCVIETKLGEIIGVMDFAPQRGGPDTSYLALLMISAPSRSMGYGKSIMEAFEKYLVNTFKSRVLKAGVMVNNPKAIRFWESMGFNINRTPELLRDKTTVFRLSKNISK